MVGSYLVFLAPFCMEREVERDRLRFQTDWVVRMYGACNLSAVMS